MELLTLRTFAAVVDEGGILAASRKLNTVQSNVTNRIRRLEDELGTELFFRSGRGVELAPAGRVLLGYARKMLSLERQATNAVRQAGESFGELRIGAMETFTALHLPAALRDLRAAHPGLDLRVCTDTSAALAEKVLSHKLDCAFVAGPVNHPELAFDELLVEELVQVAAPGIDPSRAPLILFREGCVYRARALAWQRTIGHPLSDAMEFGTLEGILGCVSVGLGWTLMPRRVVEQSAHAAQLQVGKVPDEIAHVPTGMVRPQDRPPMRVLQALAEAVAAAGRRSVRQAPDKEKAINP
ncbi:LysR family transcriptional regulator [Thauera sp. CAU 1555]|uniref:LysR family transcriptional regulator n=1 Tax=Thauera sedimentorum TaxID=2767595 RepID=A0ABR9B661_9RHOO|nr:LysR substrate-binding domain-containing protein [Thauera sedimentorum]MBC9070939.1 LysR family transcriptional regulator [Thauera sedimentorum]MBD8501858.1 LysR family transcriptional regulator [Thauera sedimentorum]